MNAEIKESIHPLTPLSSYIKVYLMARPADIYESTPSKSVRFSLGTDGFHPFNETFFKALRIAGFDKIDHSIEDLIDTKNLKELHTKTKFGFERVRFYNYTDEAKGIPLAYIKNHLPDDSFSMILLEKQDYFVLYITLSTHSFTTTVHLTCTISPDGKFSKAWAYVNRDYADAQYLTQMDIAIRALGLGILADDIVDMVIEDVIWEVNERRDEWVNNSLATSNTLTLPIDGFDVSMEEYMEEFSYEI